MRVGLQYGEKRMKYLFFDIECCDGVHMCEFGYVLIDEQFNVLDRDCITINPEHEFRLSGREKESDIKLAFPEEVYYNSPKFDFYYDRLKGLLTMPDCQIVGFSLSNDAGFLATAYERYGKEPISFTYCDFQNLYQGYTKSKNRTSVGNIVEELQIGDITLHKSDDDSFAVVKVLQIISAKESLNCPETIKMLKKCNNNYRAEVAKERNRSLVEKAINGDLNAQKAIMKKFIHKLKLSKEKQDELFFGKQVCISSHFQNKRFNEFLAIIKQLYSFGATYTGKTSECDIFIEYQDGNEEDIRYATIKQAEDTESKAIQILSLDEALKALNLTEKDLNKIDHIGGKSNYNGKGYRYKKEEQTSYTSGNSTTTLGDLLKIQNVDWSKFKED
jgi:DNA polymerase III alpha subunit (gram-positive type)